jgi:selenocysteine lyase/cysteine desulfurase
MERIDLSFAGYDSGREHRPDGALTIHAGARRYETSTAPALLAPGWLEALRWLESLGWSWIHERIREAQASARRRLAALPGVSVLTPPGPQAGLVTFTAAGAEPEAAVRALAERRVMLRWTTAPPALRASLGFFNDDGDVERLAAEVASLGG